MHDEEDKHPSEIRSWQNTGTSGVFIFLFAIILFFVSQQQRDAKSKPHKADGIAGNDICWIMYAKVNAADTYGQTQK